MESTYSLCEVFAAMRRITETEICVRLKGGSCVIRLAIMLEEKKYAEDIMRGLSRASMLISSRIEDGDAVSDADVVLTDSPEKGASNLPGAVLIGRQEILSVHEILYRIADAADAAGKMRLPDRRIYGDPAELRGKSALKEDRAGGSACVRSFAFVSEFGGSGVTSLSLVFARLLAAAFGRKVILVSGDAGEYVPHEGNSPKRPIRELEYMLSYGREPLIGRYAQEDKYGVALINTNGAVPDSTFFEKLCCAEDTCREYAFCVFDCGRVRNRSGGKTGKGDDGVVSADVVFDVRRASDSRACEDRGKTGKGSGRYTVLNCCCINGSADGVFTVPESRESFTNRGETVEIDMRGEFASGVTEIVRWAEKNITGDGAAYGIR